MKYLLLFYCNNGYKKAPHDTFYFVACIVDQLSYKSDSFYQCVMEFQNVLISIQLTVGRKPMSDALLKT